jgi:hypothetical protein
MVLPATDVTRRQLAEAIPNGLARWFISPTIPTFVIGDYRIIDNEVIVAIREGINNPSEEPEGVSFFKFTVENVTEVGASIDDIVRILLEGKREVIDEPCVPGCLACTQGIGSHGDTAEDQ